MLRPARRGALADSARPPRRHGTLIRLSSRLPVSALFGLRLAARRPRRALLSAASIAITVCGIVAVLAFHATVSRMVTGGGDRHGARNPARCGRAHHRPCPDRRPHPGAADPPVRNGVIPERRCP
jgi:hypothetical protein